MPFFFAEVRSQVLKVRAKVTSVDFISGQINQVTILTRLKENIKGVLTLLSGIMALEKSRTHRMFQRLKIISFSGKTFTNFEECFPLRLLHRAI